MTNNSFRFELKCSRPLKGLIASLIVSAFAIANGASAVCGQTARPPRSATQFWSEQQFAAPVNDRVDLVLLGYLHLGRKSERPVAEHVATGLGVSFRLGKHLTVFPFFTHFENQLAVAAHSKEERLTIEATLKFPLRHVTLSYRHRFEYHWRKPTLNFIHDRNRIQLEHSLNFGKLTGFVADEFFYDTHFDAWIRNRIYAGVSKKVNRHFSFELYYMRQNDGHSRPGDLNVLGNTLKFRL
jgi:hypothetical protein